MTQPYVGEVAHIKKIMTPIKKKKEKDNDNNVQTQFVFHFQVFLAKLLLCVGGWVVFGGRL